MSLHFPEQREESFLGIANGRIPHPCFPTLVLSVLVTHPSDIRNKSQAKRLTKTDVRGNNIFVLFPFHPQQLHVNRVYSSFTRPREARRRRDRMGGMTAAPRGLLCLSIISILSWPSSPTSSWSWLWPCQFHSPGFTCAPSSDAAPVEAPCQYSAFGLAMMAPATPLVFLTTLGRELSP